MALSMQKTGAKSENGSPGPIGLPDFHGDMDPDIFEQILEMDDDNEKREFSKAIVYDFFSQAKQTFQKMDQNLQKRDLAQISSLGYFLTGSSAALGMTKVRESCVKIQRFGANKSADGSKDEPNDEKCLENLYELLKQAKQDFAEAEKRLRQFYEPGST